MKKSRIEIHRPFLGSPGPRTDVSAESPLIGTDLSKGKRWRKSVDILTESSRQNLDSL